MGDNFYTNFDVVILDGGKVKIGDNCLIAPQVGIYTAYHPLDAETRRKGLEYVRPVTIGNDCWIGGGVIINPGVTLETEWWWAADPWSQRASLQELS